MSPYIKHDVETGGLVLHYELYVDRFFFSQFVMHLILLVLTAITGRYRLVRWKTVTAAAGGSLFLVVVFLWPSGEMYAGVKVILQMAGTLVMLQAAFGFDSMKACIRAGMYYGICAVFMGGALHVLCRRNGNLWLVLAWALALAFLGVCWNIHEKRQSQSALRRVRLSDRKYSYKLKALVDTGNSLYDPVSHKPVCVVHTSAVKALHLAERPEVFRVIPYHSIGRTNGILYAWVVEKMEVNLAGQKRMFHKVLLAQSDQLLPHKGYQMLLHPALLEEEKGEKHDFKSCDAGEDAV